MTSDWYSLYIDVVITNVILLIIDKKKKRNRNKNILCNNKSYENLTQV